MPESAWLPSDRISHFIDTKGALDTVDEVGSEVHADASDSR